MPRDDIQNLPLLWSTELCSSQAHRRFYSVMWLSY